MAIVVGGAPMRTRLCIWLATGHVIAQTVLDHRSP